MPAYTPEKHRKPQAQATHAVPEADHPAGLINVDINVSIDNFEPVDELPDVDVSDKGARVGVGLYNVGVIVMKG